MTRVENRHVILFRQFVNCSEQGSEIFLCIDILLPVGRKQHIFTRFQTKPVQNIRTLNCFQILIQYLCHRTSCYINTLFWQSALMQILSSLFSQPLFILKNTNSHLHSLINVFLGNPSLFS